MEDLKKKRNFGLTRFPTELYHATDCVRWNSNMTEDDVFFDSEE